MLAAGLVCCAEDMLRSATPTGCVGLRGGFPWRGEGGADRTGQGAGEGGLSHRWSGLERGRSLDLKVMLGPSSQSWPYSPNSDPRSPLRLAPACWAACDYRGRGGVGPTMAAAASCLGQDTVQPSWLAGSSSS